MSSMVDPIEKAQTSGYLVRSFCGMLIEGTFRQALKDKQEECLKSLNELYLKEGLIFRHSKEGFAYLSHRAASELEDGLAVYFAEGGRWDRDGVGTLPKIIHHGASLIVRVQTDDQGIVLKDREKLFCDREGYLRNIEFSPVLYRQFALSPVKTRWERLLENSTNWNDGPF